MFIIAELPSMVFSCEMTSSQIVQRLLFARSRYAITNLRDGIKPQKEDLKRIKRVAAEINLAKNRNGTTGSIPLNFIKELMRFETRAFVNEPN